MRSPGGVALVGGHPHTPVHGSVRLEQLQLLVHDVVLALTLDEVDPGDVGGLREGVDLADEPVADRGQRRGRGDRQAEMLLDVADHPAHVLQPRLVHIAVQPIDALDLEDDMVGEDFGDGAGYLHHRLRSTGGQSRPTNRTDGSYTRDRSVRPRGIPAGRSPHTRTDPATRLDGPGRSPVSGLSQF